MSTVDIKVDNGNTPLVKLFKCFGSPCSMVEKNTEVIERKEGGNYKDVSLAQSPLARDLHLLFMKDSEWIKPVHIVKLTAANEGGDVIDAVGVKLHDSFKWDDNLLGQAKGFFERRVMEFTGASLPTMQRDFTTATDEEVRAVFAATLPSEVFKDNHDPDNAITVENIDRQSGEIKYQMSQACGDGSCGLLSLQGTKNRISAAMGAYYGAKALQVS